MKQEKECVNLYQHIEKVDVITSSLQLVARMTERIVESNDASTFRNLNFSYMSAIDKLERIEVLKAQKDEYEDLREYELKMDALRNDYYYWVHKMTKHLFSILPF